MALIERDWNLGVICQVFLRPFITLSIVNSFVTFIWLKQLVFILTKNVFVECYNFECGKDTVCIKENLNMVNENNKKNNSTVHCTKRNSNIF